MSSLNMYFHREESEYATVLSEDVEFVGELEANESLFVKGNITGSKIKVTTLLIANNAYVTEKVESDILVIFGKAEGKFKTKDMLYLSREGTIIGEIEVAVLQIEVGGTFNGSCKMVSAQSDKENISTNKTV